MPKHHLHLDQRNGCYGFTFCVVYFFGGDQKNGPIPQENLAHCQKNWLKVWYNFVFPFCLFVFSIWSIWSTWSGGVGGWGRCLADTY